MRFLVTGAAGFIGSTLCEHLLEYGHEVLGVDCFRDYYPRPLKEANLTASLDYDHYRFVEADLTDTDMRRLLDGVEVVIHLAAQAGVRRSWGDNFRIYTQDNILSTQAILETAKELNTGRVVYASSSSIYGLTEDLPMREGGVLNPVSPYGVTKLAGENLAVLYNKNFGLDTVSLRYFTVYGPRQRPDMAFHRFIRALLEDSGIRLFGDGGQSRDFTFVNDTVDATIKAALAPDIAGQVFNIGGGARISVNRVIETLEEMTGRKARVNRLATATGDVRKTEADMTRARDMLGFKPAFSLKEGLENQIDWIKKNLPLLQEVVS